MPEVPSESILKLVAWLLDQPGVTELFQERLGLSGVSVSAPSDERASLLLTVAQAANLLSVPKDRVYALASSKQIPSMRFGKTVRIPRRPLELWAMGLATGAKKNASPLAPTDELPQSQRFSQSRPSKPPKRHEPEHKSPATGRKQSSPTERSWLNTAEAAERLQMSVDMVRRLTKSGQLPCIKLSNRNVYTENLLAEYLRHDGVPPAEGWERFFNKQHFQTSSPEEQAEMIEYGFNPETGEWKKREY